MSTTALFSCPESFFEEVSSEEEQAVQGGVLGIDIPLQSPEVSPEPSPLVSPPVVSPVPSEGSESDDEGLGSPAIITRGHVRALRAWRAEVMALRSEPSYLPPHPPVPQSCILLMFLLYGFGLEDILLLHCGGMELDRLEAMIDGYRRQSALMRERFDFFWLVLSLAG